MVRDVFTQEAIVRLIGGMGIGHGELLLASHLPPNSPESTFWVGHIYLVLPCLLDEK